MILLVKKEAVQLQVRLYGAKQSEMIKFGASQLNVIILIMTAVTKFTTVKALIEGEASVANSTIFTLKL